MAFRLTELLSGCLLHDYGTKSNDADDGDSIYPKRRVVGPIIDAAGRERKIHRNVDISFKVRSQN
jgi:hypothetical protein